MKLLLVAINAKYIHSNLAVYSLKSYAGEYSKYIEIAEYTVNQSNEEVLKGIYRSGADIVAFSCYIWNIGMVKRIMPELKKVSPRVKIWLGGPEVSYDAEKFLLQNPAADGIITGEGEQTFLELVRFYADGNMRLEDIAGLVYKAAAESNRDNNEPGSDRIRIVSTGARKLLSMDSLPFAYEAIFQTPGILDNRIIYYESSRGCPFSCSYCLSSIDKRLRFRDIIRVKNELKAFMDHKVAQVKFVDRTFNCNKNHAMEIWNFIKQHDNGITNFHFEISADLLDSEALELLTSLRPGQVQFEIGVQSINPDTLKAIHRKMDLDRLYENVRKLREGGNIHLHLDLIAGLPMEDYASFEKSFDYVYKLKPDQLQLGFLKVLKGSCMEQDSSRYGIVYRDEPPYEVLFTDWLSYDEMLKLKGICEMVEVYYNSGQFKYSIMFLEHFYNSSMKLYEDLYAFYERKGLFDFQHSRLKRYEILLDFLKEQVLKSYKSDNISLLADLFKELLIFDLCLRENLRSRPCFYTEGRNKDELRKLYESYRDKGKFIQIEIFDFDLIKSAVTGKPVLKTQAVVFDYGKRDPINKSAEIKLIELN